MNKKPAYLQEGRLADVLALIQVLAYDRDSYRSEDGLQRELQRLPATRNTWMDLASQHPEFFRVTNEPSKLRIALLARYVLQREETEDGIKKPPLKIAVTNKLMELAITLHDKQLERHDRWKTWAPMIIAIIAAIASIVVACVNIGGKQMPPIARPTVSFTIDR